MSNLTYFLIYLGIGSLLNLLFIILNKHKFRMITQRTITEDANEGDISLLVFILIIVQFFWFCAIIMLTVAVFVMVLDKLFHTKLKHLVPR